MLGAFSVGAIFFYQSERLGEQSRRLSLLETAMEKESPRLYATYQDSLKQNPDVTPYAIAQPIAERLLGKGAKLADLVLVAFVYPAACLLVAGTTHRLLTRQAGKAAYRPMRRALGAT